VGTGAADFGCLIRAFHDDFPDCLGDGLQLLNCTDALPNLCWLFSQPWVGCVAIGFWPRGKPAIIANIFVPDNSRTLFPVFPTSPARCG
jgi:hypothetical protein